MPVQSRLGGRRCLLGMIPRGTRLGHPRLACDGPARARPRDRPAGARRAGRRAAVRRPRLGLPARRRGAARRARGGQRAARQLRPARRRRRRRGALPRALRAARRRARAARRAAARRTPATCRPGRATCASAPARGSRSQRGAHLATGHTASDQAETVLYRLAASPGRRALLGMAERDGLLVRPLLRVTREETAAHCTARGLTWREDASNDDPAYARNRARAGLVPALRELHPSAERNVVRTAELLRDEAAVLDEVVDDRARRPRPHRGRAPRRAAAGARAARRAAPRRGRGRPACARAPPGRLADILALGDGALDLGDGARAVVSGGVLRVEPTPAGRSAPTARRPASSRAPDRLLASHARRRRRRDPRPAR